MTRNRKAPKHSNNSSTIQKGEKDIMISTYKMPEVYIYFKQRMNTHTCTHTHTYNLIKSLIIGMVREQDKVS